MGFGRKLLNPPVPLAVFNVVVALICLALFFTFLSTIIGEYIAALDRPPTVLGISVQNPLFPDMLVCNTMSSWDVAAIEACKVEFGSEEFEECCTTFRVGEATSGGEDCGISFETFNISSLRPGRADSTCVQFHTESLRGFVEAKGFAIPNSLELSIDATPKEEVSSQSLNR